jgi:hypothetical protein
MQSSGQKKGMLQFAAPIRQASFFQAHTSTFPSPKTRLPRLWLSAPSARLEDSPGGCRRRQSQQTPDGSLRKNSVEDAEI